MRARIAGVLVVVCGLTGWLAGDAEAQAPKKPCTLISASQVSAAVGLKFDPGQPIGATGCQWGTMSGVDPHVVATLSFQDPAGWAKMKAGLPGAPQQPAGGIGNDAFYTIFGPLATLSVKGKGAVFNVKLYGIHDLAKEKAMEKALALDALGKL